MALKAQTKHVLYKKLSSEHFNGLLKKFRNIWCQTLAFYPTCKIFWVIVSKIKHYFKEVFSINTCLASRTAVKN